MAVNYFWPFPRICFFLFLLFYLVGEYLRARWRPASVLSGFDSFFFRILAATDTHMSARLDHRRYREPADLRTGADEFAFISRFSTFSVGYTNVSRYSNRIIFILSGHFFEHLILHRVAYFDVRYHRPAFFAQSETAEDGQEKND